MYKVVKRILDIIVAVVLLIALLPLFIPIMVLLRLTAEGEVFYLQKRIGYKNSTFKIWKFATILKDSPNIGTGTHTLRNDPRVTPVGKYLRISKINELPQLINILKGDMSIVGPRPQVKKDFEAYPENIRQVIYNVIPGITGIGSIIFRDEEKLMSASDLDPHEYYVQNIAPYKGALELWYQKNASLFTDVLLIFLTAWVIIFPDSQLIYRIFRDLPKRPKELLAQQAELVRLDQNT